MIVDFFAGVAAESAEGAVKLASRGRGMTRQVREKSGLFTVHDEFAMWTLKPEAKGVKENLSDMNGKRFLTYQKCYIGLRTGHFRRALERANPKGHWKTPDYPFSICDGILHELT